MRPGSTKYVESPLLLLFVDGVPLDELLACCRPDQDLIGLIPALGNLLSREDNELAAQRLLPAEGQSSIAPVLICPDDLDFACTTVVALVSNRDGTIVWERLGTDMTAWSPSRPQLGQRIDWFENVGPFVFADQSYRDAVDKLRAEAQSA